MQIKLFFVTLSALSMLQSLFNCLYLMETEDLAKIACKATKDIISKQPHTQDVLIGDLGQLASKNKLISCIGHEIPVLVTCLKTQISERNLRKATVVILILDKANVVSLVTIA